MSKDLRDGKDFTCPLCGGCGAISVNQLEAIEYGKACAIVNVDFEGVGIALSQTIGDQIAEVLADYNVQLVKRVNDD